MSLFQLSVSFEVQDEDKLDLSALCAEIEHRLSSLDGVEGAFADVGGATRRFSLVVELEGEGADCALASSEMVAAIQELVPRLVNEPRAGRTWPLEEDDCS